MIKLKTVHEHLKGVSVFLPHVGKVDIDLNGHFDVDESHVEAFMLVLPGYSIAKSTEEIAEEAFLDLVKEIKSKKLEELKDLCEPFPTEEWEGLQKKELQEYLTNKLK